MRWWRSLFLRTLVVLVVEACGGPSPIAGTSGDAGPATGEDAASFHGGFGFTCGALGQPCCAIATRSQPIVAGERVSAGGLTCTGGLACVMSVCEPPSAADAGAATNAGGATDTSRPADASAAADTVGDVSTSADAKPVGEADSGDAPGARAVWSTLAVGGEHSCVLRGSKVECWGENWGGELGIGSGSGPESCNGLACSPAAVTVTTLSAPVDSVAAGQGETCALLVGGTVACWGANDSGQLGDGSTSGPELCPGQLPCSTVPRVVSGVSGATAIATSGTAACAVLSSGAVECWGSNLGGELGYKTVETASGNPVSSVPTLVSGLTRATAVGVGDGYACALLSDGTIECWGSNGYGQLGNGSTADSTTPVPVSDVTDATAIAVGESHACARMADGTVMCWGENGDAQLGLATAQTCGSSNPCATTPAKVPGLSGVTAVAAGLFDTCALLSDGTVRCWGSNEDGQLGDGTTMVSATPVVVSGLSGASAISTAGMTACALVSNGDVVCWGNNTDGNLGSAMTGSSDVRGRQPVLDHTAESLRVVTPSKCALERTCSSSSVARRGRGPWRSTLPCSPPRACRTRPSASFEPQFPS